MESVARKLLRPILRGAVKRMPEPEGPALRAMMREKTFARALDQKAERLALALLSARRDQSEEQFAQEARELIDFSLTRPEWTLLDGCLGGSRESTRTSILSLLVERGLPPARVQLVQSLLRARLVLPAEAEKGSKTAASSLLSRLGGRASR
jgi:hypothetical protein